MRIPTLITTKAVLELIPWVSADGLRKGCRGTNVLTRFPHGLWSKEEVLALRDDIVMRGIKPARRRRPVVNIIRRRSIPTELI